MKSFSEDILRSTMFALIKHAPRLAVELKKKVEASGSFVPPPQKRGSSIHAKISFEPSESLPGRIAEVLRSIESLEGPASTYGGRQVNYLLRQWTTAA